MIRLVRRTGLLAAACAALSLWAGWSAAAAEVSTDVVALVSGGGKIALATDGSPQFGLEVYLGGSEGKLGWGLDVWGRTYTGPRWVGLALGWRNLQERFGVVTAQAGYRFAIAPDAFVDAGFGLQVRTNGFVGIVPRIYFGWRW